MFSQIGNSLLQLSILLPFVALIINLVKPNIARSITQLYLLVNISAYLTLLSAFICFDFSVYNVFMNSSNIMPLIYRIAGSWGSHEGSILLWFSLLSIASLATINYPTISAEIKCKYITNFILAPISIAFASFIYFTSNPFIALGELNQGVGLNPILQDIGLTIHPPILYMGYVMLIAPFIFSYIALIMPSKLKLCLSAMLLFSQIALFFLTCGIGLGSWWAYRELGWGGFWFFDPVENISLLPLILAIMLHHCLLSSIRYGKLYRTSIFLGISGFITTLFSTFIVRSGLLISVHSFADTSNRSYFILLIFIISSLLSYLLFTLRYKLIPTHNISKIYEASFGIKSANFIWLAALLILIFSILLPILAAKYGHNISIEASFYSQFFLPFILINSILAAIYCLKLPILSQKHLTILGAIILCISSITIYLLKISYLTAIIAIIAVITMLITVITRIYTSSTYSPRMIAMLTSHFGLGLLILSITLNNIWQQEYDFIGTNGNKIQTQNYIITLKNIRYSEEENYYRQIAEFWVEDNDHKIFIMQPENRLYKIEQALTSEIDIHSLLTHDLYIVISKINDKNVYAKIYYRPFIGWLWISITLIAAGIFISFAAPKT